MSEVLCPKKKSRKFGIRERGECSATDRREARHRSSLALVAGGPAGKESLRQLLKDGEREREGGTVTRIEIPEPRGQRIVPLRTDPIEQPASSGRRRHATDALVDLVADAPHQTGRFQFRNQAREHRRVEAGEAGKIRQANRALSFRGDEDVDLGRCQCPGRSGRPEPARHAVHRDPQQRRVQVVSWRHARTFVDAQAQAPSNS